MQDSSLEANYVVKFNIYIYIYGLQRDLVTIQCVAYREVSVTTE